MGIPVTEQETTVSFNRGSDTASIWTSDSTVMTKLDKLVESSPECWQLTRTDTVGKDLVGKEYTAKKRLISFRSKFTERVMTEAQRQASAERMRLARIKSE